MTLLAIAVLPFHLALMLLAAPLLAGVMEVVAARASGRTVPSPLQPLRDLRRLSRTQALLPEGASWLRRAAPVVSAASTLAAAALVPSFARGMATAPLADALTVAGLLAMADGARLLALADGGAAWGGNAAVRGVVLGALAWPAAALIILVLGLIGGGTGLGAAAGPTSPIGAAWGPETLFAGAAMLALALAAFGDPRAADDAAGQVWGGADLALVRATAMLRRVVVPSLVWAVALPFGLTLIDTPAAGWSIEFLGWLTTLLVLGAASALIEARRSAARTPDALTRGVLAVAALLGGLALAVLLARQVGA